MICLGMDVVLVYLEGYEIMLEVEEVVKKNVVEFGGNFIKMNSMVEVFKDVDVVYLKSWVFFVVMEKWIELYGNGD